MLSALIRLALVPVCFVLSANQLFDMEINDRYYLFMVSGAAFATIILVAVYAYLALMFGWAGTGRSDRNTMRSEAHVEKIMANNIELAKLQQPIHTNTNS